LNDYSQSALIDKSKKILYPGERVLETRKNNLGKGKKVMKKEWDEIMQL